MIKKYSVVGYDKDNDVYVKYAENYNVETAIEQAKILFECVKEGYLTRKCSDGNNEPIDRIEVYYDWDGDEENIIWASYECCQEKEGNHYMLYGVCMIRDDSSLAAFARSLMDKLECDYQIDVEMVEDEDEYKDNVMSAVFDRIEHELCLTQINYEELLGQYTREIGQLLYDMENHGYDMSNLNISFFENCKENFNMFLYSYVDIHFEELSCLYKTYKQDVTENKAPNVPAADRFRVKIPGGFLMVEEKGVENEYPGVYISYSKHGREYDVNNIVACVEYDTCAEVIKTEAYKKEKEDPVEIVDWP